MLTENWPCFKNNSNSNKELTFTHCSLTIRIYYNLMLMGLTELWNKYCIYKKNKNNKQNNKQNNMKQNNEKHTKFNFRRKMW